MGETRTKEYLFRPPVSRVQYHGRHQGSNERKPANQTKIVETDDPSEFNRPLFAHARVGKNKDPFSKIDAFADFMEKGIGNKADIAFFKFCYVDIGAETDVEKVFSDYKNSLSSLMKTYPKTTFVHVTVPLKSLQSGIKAFVKKIIGRPMWGYDDNIKRNQFNELLRKEYDGKAPIFDLARTESTLPDGKRSSFSKDGKNYYFMVPDYTHDGGHLNELGRKRAAEQLLVVLTT